METSQPRFRHFLTQALPFFALCALAFLVYSNTYHHSYPLDAGHHIVDNMAIRSLTNIPRFFVDANTSSSLVSNIDYRPITLITFALNYAISGLDTWSWHLGQILLHSLFACFFYLFTLEICRRFLVSTQGPYQHLIALFPALVYVVHPTSSGVVNYLCARTTLLESAFLMMAFYYALKRRPGVESSRVRWSVVLLYTLALFTKVETIGALAVLYFIDLLQHRTTSSPWRDLLSPLRDREFYRRFAPLLLVSIGYFVLRQYVMRDYNTATRASHSTLTYLSTQITTWWFYLYHWFVPLHLVADDLTYPIFANFWQPEVLLALFAWAGAFIYLLVNYQRTPVYFYLALSYFAMLSPTSSLVPLQEMVNEHRPYLPLALASLLWVLPSSTWLLRRCSGTLQFQRPLTIATVIFVGIMASLTYQRNKVYLNDLAYWQDVVDKAPSSRAYLNYALSLMAVNRLDEAEHYLLRAEKEAPHWNTVHINMGVLYQNRGDLVRARQHFDLGVQYDVFTSNALVFRGGFFIDTKVYDLALEDLTKALPTQTNKFGVYRSIATAYAGLNDCQQALHYTNLMYMEDPQATEFSIVGISTPFFTSADRTRCGITYFEHLREILPGREWIEINIKTLQSRLVG